MTTCCGRYPRETHSRRKPQLEHQDLQKRVTQVTLTSHRGIVVFLEANKRQLYISCTLKTVPKQTPTIAWPSIPRIASASVGVRSMVENLVRGCKAVALMGSLLPRPNYAVVSPECSQRTQL